ncbi:MAG: rod shape-determining protein MreD [Anaerolineae bacterium]|nr:rod shape-determining protein MreD [Anaerolineae bacterium]
MDAYLSIPVLAVAVIIQSTVMPEIRLGGAMPDLVYLLVLAWSLLAGFERGVTWALVGGVLQDLVSSLPLGTTALSLVLLTFVLSLLVGQVNPRNLIYPAVIAAGGTVVLHGVTLLVLGIAGQALPFLDTLTYVTLPSLVYNLIVMIPLYRVLGGFYLSSRPRRISDIR